MKRLLLLLTLIPTLMLYAQKTGIPSDLAITGATSNLSPEAKNLGLNSVVLESSSSGNFTFVLNADNVLFNGTSTQFKNKRILIKENQNNVELVYDEGITAHFTKADRKIYFKAYDEQIVDISEVKEESYDEITTAKCILAVTLIREFVDKSILRTQASAKRGDWYVVNGGFSRSTSINRTEREVSRFLRNNPNCSKSGNTDTSCVTDEHLCFSTQYFTCM